MADQQVALLRQRRTGGKSQETAAAIAGMSVWSTWKGTVSLRPRSSALGAPTPLPRPFLCGWDCLRIGRDSPWRSSPADRLIPAHRATDWQNGDSHPSATCAPCWSGLLRRRRRGGDNHEPNPAHLSGDAASSVWVSVETCRHVLYSRTLLAPPASRHARSERAPVIFPLRRSQ